MSTAFTVAQIEEAGRIDERELTEIYGQRVSLFNAAGGVNLATPNWGLQSEADALYAGSNRRVELALDARALASEGAMAGVDQGSLGDCWFLSSVAATVGNVQGGVSLVSQMISKNADGSYTVTFPGDPNAPQIVTHSLLEQLAGAGNIEASAGWADILQAAAYELDPSQMQNGGYAATALNLMTGRQTESMYTGNSNLAQTLEQALQGHQAVVAASQSDLGANGDSPIVSDHAYTVVGFNAFTDMVVVRNPWGNTGTENFNTLLPGQTMDGVTAIGAGELKMSLSTFENDFSFVSYTTNNMNQGEFLADESGFLSFGKGLSHEPATANLGTADYNLVVQGMSSFSADHTASISIPKALENQQPIHIIVGGFHH